jgi:hypothetical protein
VTDIYVITNPLVHAVPEYRQVTRRDVTNLEDMLLRDLSAEPSA